MPYDGGAAYVAFSLLHEATACQKVQTTPTLPATINGNIQNRERYSSSKRCPLTIVDEIPRQCLFISVEVIDMQGEHRPQRSATVEFPSR